MWGLDCNKEKQRMFSHFRGRYCANQMLQNRCTGFGRWCERTFYYCCTDSQTLEHFFLHKSHIFNPLFAPPVNLPCVPLFTCFYLSHTIPHTSFWDCQSKMQNVLFDSSTEIYLNPFLRRMASVVTSAKYM